MIYTNYTRLLFFACLTMFLGLVSCQKGIDPAGADPGIPDGVKDSTLLIKSITWLYRNGSDSIVEHYSYDTVNRKITLSWTDSGTEPLIPGYQSEYNNSKAELSYNSKGLLVHMAYTYPPSYSPWEFDNNTIDITYDSDNIVHKIAVKYVGGSTSSCVFTKTMLQGGGYRLDWNMSDPDTYFRTVVFSSDGKNILNTIDHRLTEMAPSGNPVEYKFINTDSLVYDATGNVVKVLTNYIDGRTNNVETYTSYEYNGRQTKGDQLYNQRQIIMNGIANMPFGDIDYPVEDAFGILSFNLDYEYLQFEKYPFQTTKARMWDGTFKDFISNSTFDSKNRLTKFIGFFHDYDLEPREYRISYYK